MLDSTGIFSSTYLHQYQDSEQQYFGQHRYIFLHISSSIPGVRAAIFWTAQVNPPNLKEL